MTSATDSRRWLAEGARAGIPMAFAVGAFGLVYGVAVGESTVSEWVGVAASWVILAGAAQLAVLDQLDGGAGWPVAIATGLVINARHVLYSAALAPAFGEFPRRWRLGLPYVLTDQTAALSMVQFTSLTDPFRRRWWFLGAAAPIVGAWWVCTIVGLAVGGTIPDEVDIGFTIPAMFIALLAPSLTTRPAAATAVVAGAVAVLSAPLPSGLNIVVGAVSGLAAGRLAMAAGGQE